MSDDSKDRIQQAFSQVNRVDFMPNSYRNFASLDRPFPIWYGQTISQPSTVRFMLELLDPIKWDKVLDIGSWSGWTTALLGNIVGNKGEVIGVEVVPELVVFGKNNLRKYPEYRVEIRQAGNSLGAPGQKFDRILVSASAEKFPSELLEQLRPNGRLVIPIEQSIFLYEKDSGWHVRHQEYPGYVFVPLIWSG